MSLMPFISIPVMAFLVVFQSAFLSYATVGGTPIQVIPVVVIAWAMWRGSAEGAVWAFVAGLFLDYASIGPFGVSSVALIVAVVAISPLFPNLAYNRLTLPFILAGGAMLIFQLTSLLLLRFAGYPIVAQYWREIPLATTLNALVTIPFFWLFTSFSRYTRRERAINL
ncbi:MAG: rod shape-determining protein MreD [Candidatus Promineifilaceae bacterium]